MKEVSPNIFIGTVEELRTWPGKALAACKEPCHREALGYTGRGAPKESPEYYIAIRGKQMILNLVDGHSHKFIDVPMIENALGFITSSEPTLIVCNQGHSRSPIITMMWLYLKGLIEASNFAELENKFKQVYPAYAPSDGIRTFAELYLFDREKL